MNQSLLLINLILTALIILGLFWSIWKTYQLDKIRREFFSKGLEKNLEEVLVEQNRKNTNLGNESLRLSQALNELSIQNKNNLRKIGFIRFNPFEDAGGNMSFALALLNENDNGIVVSSLHGREGTRIYAKAVRKGKSESKLTEEEVQAIKQAG